MSSPIASQRKRLYISYAKEDSKFVDWLRSRLRDWLDSTWEIIDSDETVVGQAIFDVISKVIRSSDAMIYVSSRFATESDNVQAELAWGLAQGQTRPSFKIIPILRDEAATVPHLLRGFLYLDFREGTDKEGAFRTLGSHLLQGEDMQPIATDSERLRAEANFIELKSALLQEQYAIMRELEAEKTKGLRRTLFTTVVAAVVMTTTVVVALWQGTDFRMLVVFQAVFFLFMITTASIAYNSGARDYYRHRAAKIDGLLGKGPTDPFRGYGGP